jgi:murein hydrolase activator
LRTTPIIAKDERVTRWIALTLVPLLAMAGSSVAVSPPVGTSLALARAEQAAAQREADRLTEAAAQARGTVERLAAQRKAAAAELAAAEAAISAAAAELDLRRQAVAASERQLAERQAPVAALVAGLVNLGRRPPILAIADGESVTELVRVRMLLDSTLPEIRARSAALRKDLARNQALEAEARGAAARLVEASRARSAKQQRLAALEAEASRQAERLGSSALSAGDRSIAAEERAASLASRGAQEAAARRMAAELARLDAAQQRPFKPDSRAGRPPLPYRMPVEARVIDGTGSVSASGIASRGITVATYRGAQVIMPSDGTIAFAGPYGRHDGVVIIDHGEGWMTLLTGVRASAARGARLRAGAPLGRALGPVTVELSINGRPVSAATTALAAPVTGR